MWVINETMNHWLKLLDHARKIPNLDAYTNLFNIFFSQCLEIFTRLITQ